jgi:hypothetical protein
MKMLRFMLFGLIGPIDLKLNFIEYLIHLLKVINAALRPVSKLGTIFRGNCYPFIIWFRVNKYFNVFNMYT